LNESKATRYQRLRRRAQCTSLAAGALLLLLMALTPAARWLAQAASEAAVVWPAVLQPGIALGLFVGSLALAAEIVALPASIWAATRSSKRGRRPEVQLGAVTRSQARDAVAGATIGLAAASLLHLSMWAGGAWWWALASLMLACATLAALSLLSLGLAISGETRPLHRPALAARLRALAERACGRPVDLREWTSSDGRGATAVVTGVGRGGRVLLSSAMVRDWADDEIAVVVAHELSHHRHHDLARKVAVDAVVWGLALGLADRVVLIWGRGLGLNGVSDLAALPVLALVAGAVWCLVRPLRLEQSRAHERRADWFALDLTGDAEAFGRALRRLGEQHLAEERPSRLTRWFFHRHPTLEERLALGRDFASGQG